MFKSGTESTLRWSWSTRYLELWHRFVTPKPALRPVLQARLACTRSSSSKGSRCECPACTSDEASCSCAF
eukprot:6209821-Pleurochrysis_carterae.AAC.1